MITGANGYIGKFLCGYLPNTIPLIGDILNIPECDVIVHCAGRKPEECVTLDDFIRDNVITNLELAELAKGIPIIYLSSKAVLKQTPYGVTKLLGEFIFNDRHKKNINLRLPRIVDKDPKDEEMTLKQVGELIEKTIDGLSFKD